MRTNLQTLTAQLESVPKDFLGTRPESKLKVALRHLSTALKTFAILLAGGALVALCVGVTAPMAAAIAAAAGLSAAAHLLCKSIEESELSDSTEETL